MMPTGIEVHLVNYSCYHCVIEVSLDSSRLLVFVVDSLKVFGLLVFLLEKNESVRKIEKVET